VALNASVEAVAFATLKDQVQHGESYGNRLLAALSADIAADLFS
jgi:hypothetical protein